MSEPWNTHAIFFVGILSIIGHTKELTGRWGNKNTRVIMAVTGQVRPTTPCVLADG